MSTESTVYYIYNKYTHRFVTISTYPMDTKRIGSTATPIPEEDQRLFRFYVYNPDTDSWDFQLEEFRKDRISYVSMKYRFYLESKLSQAEYLLIILTLALSKLAIDLNPELDEASYDMLQTHVQNVLSILDWLNQVNNYYRNVLETIQTASKDDIINTVNSLDFTSFDSLFVDIDINAIVEKIKSLLS